jgi:hypothetical protein
MSSRAYSISGFKVWVRWTIIFTYLIAVVVSCNRSWSGIVIFIHEYSSSPCLLYATGFVSLRVSATLVIDSLILCITAVEDDVSTSFSRFAAGVYQ